MKTVSEMLDERKAEARRTSRAFLAALLILVAAAAVSGAATVAILRLDRPATCSAVLP